MNYDLKTPCKDCPFRNDKPFHLRPARAEDIAASLLAGETFACHKTVDYIGDDDGPGDTGKQQHCAGALIMLAHMGELMCGQLTRVAHRLGMFDPDALAMDAPVHEDADTFIDAVTPPCDAPARAWR